MVHCLVTDVESFADKIVFLFENPELMTQLGLNARKYVEENHSFKNYEDFIKMAKELKVNR